MVFILWPVGEHTTLVDNFNVLFALQKTSSFAGCATAHDARGTFCLHTVTDCFLFDSTKDISFNNFILKS